MAIKNKKPRTGKIEIDITGPDGNAFVLLGYAQQYAKQLGFDNQKIQMEVLCDMKVGFKKYKNCKFFLALTPNIDPTTNKMSVSSIEVDSKSKHLLMNAGVDVFQTKLAETIQSACNIDLTPMLQSAKAEIEKQLNSELMPGVNLKGLLNTLQIKGFYPTQKELQINVALNGNLQIDVVNYSTN